MAGPHKGTTIFQEPQCLISTGEDGQLQVEPDVLNQMRMLDRRLVIVAIVGLYRTGKSYLMNRLADRSAGFALGSTIQSKTKGIWVWVRQHPREDGTYLVLLDTEGLGDVEKGDSHHDEKIMILSALICNVLIYNNLGAMNDDMVTKLNFIATLTDILKDNANTDDAPGLVKLPMLIMTLRDFCLDLRIEDEEISPLQYLNHVLTPREGKPPAFNALRQCIIDNYPGRQCFTFDRPTSKGKLKRLEEISDDDLSEDFLADSDVFTQHIYDTCPHMTLSNGTPITGCLYASLVNSFVDALHTDKLPCIGNAMASLADNLNQSAVENASAVFEEDVSNSLLSPLDEGQLECIISNALVWATTIFRQMVFTDINGATSTKLNENVDTLTKSFMKKNKLLSREKCQKLIEDLEYTKRRKWVSGDYIRINGYEEFCQDVASVEAFYLGYPELGIEKDTILKKYRRKVKRDAQMLQGQVSAMRQTVGSKKEVEKQRQEASLKAQLSADQRARVRTEQEQKTKDLESVIRAMEEQHGIRCRALKDELDKKFNITAERDKEWMKQKHTNHIAQLRQDLRDLESRLQELRQQRYRGKRI